MYVCILGQHKYCRPEFRHCQYKPGARLDITLLNDHVVYHT